MYCGFMFYAQENILGSSLVYSPASTLWQGQVPLLKTLTAKSGRR